MITNRRILTPYVTACSILCILAISCGFSNKSQTDESRQVENTSQSTAITDSAGSQPLIDSQTIDSGEDTAGSADLVKPEKSIASSTPAKLSQKSVVNKTLRKAYEAFFPIGTALEPAMLTNPIKNKFYAEQYSSVTPTNQMKPKYVQAKEGVFTFGEADKVVNFAKSNNMVVRGHCLIWSQNLPDWFLKDGNHYASKELVFKRIKNHISTVAAHFKGKVYCWDVVNEAMNFFKPNPFDNRVDKLYDICGEDYVAYSFKCAKEADPTAKLFYNDNGCENPKKRQLMYNVLKKLKASGVPIDGVGLQGHWGIEGVTEQYLQETIDMFSGIGLEVQITELDISIYPKRLNRIGTARILKSSDLAKMSDQFTPSIAKEQAEVYEWIFRVCRKNKGKVTGITFWSPYDRGNYLTKKLGKKNYPYLFNEDLSPKLAFEKVVNF